MSLNFCVEIGQHGPIEPEIVKAQMRKSASDYSGIYTSQGVLRVNFSYSHATGAAALKKLKQEGDLSTPILFPSGPPAFTKGLLRQLHLLEWAGLHRVLQTTSQDLANVPQDDLQLLLMGMQAATIEIRTSAPLLAKIARTARVLVWLATWLLSFREMTRDVESGLDDGVPCHLSIISDDGDILTLSTEHGSSSVWVSTNVSAEILSIPSIDGLPAFKVAVGDEQRLRAWCRYERRHQSEVDAVLGVSRSVSRNADRLSVNSRGRPPSMTSSTTAESSMGVTSVRSSRWSMFSGDGKKELG